jgi:hypothetical protein
MLLSLSFFNCCFPNFLICSSFRPTEATQYLFAQKCLPQYRFFNWGYRSNILIALFTFKKATTSSTEYFGRINNTKCKWSICKLPANISNLRLSHNCRMISRNDLPMSPFNILKHILGYQIKWNLHSQTACDNFLKSAIKYRLRVFKVTPIKKIFSIFKIVLSLNSPQSKVWIISIADGLSRLIDNKSNLGENIQHIC